MNLDPHTSVYIGAHQKTGGILALFKLKCGGYAGAKPVGHLFLAKGKMQPQAKWYKKIRLYFTIGILFGVDSEISSGNHIHPCLHRFLVHNPSSEIGGIV